MCGESCGDPAPVIIGGASLLEICKYGNQYDKRALKETDFQTYVAESVNETFADLFGENVRSSLYRYLEESFSIPRDEIPDRIQDFESAMDKMLGRSSKTLGKVVVRKLSNKVGLPMDENNQYELADFVLTAKKSLLAKFSDPPQ
jgi:hypothetical protein